MKQKQIKYIALKFHQWCMRKTSLEYFRKYNTYYYRGKIYSAEELYDLFTKEKR